MQQRKIDSVDGFFAVVPIGQPDGDAKHIVDVVLVPGQNLWNCDLSDGDQ